MPRPKQSRRIADLPAFSLFKPAGVPGRLLPEVVMTFDEFEALRLADYDGLYQEQAAQRMGISRATFGRILETARKKVVRTLLEGCILRIEGGEVAMPSIRSFACKGCGHAWEVPFGAGRPEGCPSCRGQLFQRVDETTGGPGAPSC